MPKRDIASFIGMDRAKRDIASFIGVDGAGGKERYCIIYWNGWGWYQKTRGEEEGSLGGGGGGEGVEGARNRNDDRRMKHKHDEPR